jgi:hypothetical protein
MSRLFDERPLLHLRTLYAATLHSNDNERLPRSKNTSFFIEKEHEVYVGCKELVGWPGLHFARAALAKIGMLSCRNRKTALRGITVS